MKKKIFIIMLAVTLLLPLSSAFAADVFMTKTELIQWDPDSTYDGYNLFVDQGKFWLIDMEGYVVNYWEPVDENASAGMYAYLMENGNLRTHESPSYAPGGPLSAGGSQGRIEELTWDNEVVWEMDLCNGGDLDDDGDVDMEDTIEQTNRDGSTSLVWADGTFRFHHDAQRMYNKFLNEWTYIVLVWVAKSESDADNMGVDPDQLYRSRAGLSDGVTDNQDTWSPCGLMEILPDYESGEGGDLVWFWTFADHMVTTFEPYSEATWTDWSGRTSRTPLQVTNTYDTGDGDSIEGHPELLDVNGMHYSVPGGPTTDYQHCNSIDFNEDLGYVCINAKACNEFFVIDHDGTFVEGAAPGTAANGYDTNAVGALARTDAGNFKYRYGNPGNYYSGEKAGFYDEGDMEMYGTHDIQWIMAYHWRAPMKSSDTWNAPTSAYALPGGGQTATAAGRGFGHFMMFDNGCYNPMNAGSKVIELNPYLQGGDLGESTGVYSDGNPEYVWMATSVDGVDSINNPTGLSRRDQVYWEYSAGINDFYSSYISGNTRMPNGNTIVCAGSHSHFFEVTNEKTVVWEYVMPPWDASLNDGDGAFAPFKSSANMCFRFHRFAAGHPALQGRDLTPLYTLTGLAPTPLETVVTEGVSEPEAEITLPTPSGWGFSSSSVSGAGGGGTAGGATGTGGDTGY